MDTKTKNSEYFREVKICWCTYICYIDILQKFLGRFSMDATASCGFGLESNSLLSEEGEFNKIAAMVFNPSTWRIFNFIAYYIAPRLCRALGMILPSPGLRHYADIVTEVLKHREKTGIHRGDFIDLMIEARKIPDEETNAGKKHALEDLTVVSQAVVFLLAGYDNIATTLAFCCYHLANNPGIQDQARMEMKDLMKQHGNKINYDAVMEAKYLDACISETLRLYPIETSFNRLCVKDYKLGDSDLVIPKGMVIEVPVWSLHRDPEYWENPSEFRPGRFLEDKHNIRPYTYLPFGAGPRNCIGRRFAMMTTKAALAFLLQGVKMSVSPSQRHPPELACSPIILRPKNGIHLLLQTIHENEE
ncbi:heme binding [Halocaridina rubra]|uniref:Heme binding n=1 Tax=Halocaridina rubra TaxID=373956 RepID=A0AAN8XGZ7_HALRR